MALQLLLPVLLVEASGVSAAEDDADSVLLAEVVVEGEGGGVPDTEPVGVPEPLPAPACVVEVEAEAPAVGDGVGDAEGVLKPLTVEVG